MFVTDGANAMRCMGGALERVYRNFVACCI